MPGVHRKFGDAAAGRAVCRQMQNFLCFADGFRLAAGKRQADVADKKHMGLRVSFPLGGFAGCYREVIWQVTV